MLKPYTFLFIASSMCFCLLSSAQRMAIDTSFVWPDVDGTHIQAHGGAVLKHEDTYYWYGEQRSLGLDADFRYISCYQSRDLMNWKFKANVLKLGGLDSILGKEWVLERPKVYYNSNTKKFVMYMHIDGAYAPENEGGSVVANYTFARVGVAVSDHAEGPFTYLRAFRPLGKESRDIGQFVDDDGTAYLIFEDRPSGGFHIAKLSADYLDVEEDVCFIKSPLEGGAIVHYDGLYYVIGSALTGWTPNPNKYATAPSLKGPWTAFKDIAPPETNTYNSQSAFIFKVTGTKGTTVILMGDRWKQMNVSGSGYLWMPLQLCNGTLRLPEPRPWTINVKTGKWKYVKKKRGTASKK